MSISISFLKFPIFYLLLLSINFCPNICQNSIQTTTKGFLRYSHHSFSSTQYESASRRQHDEDHKTLITDFNAVRPTSAQFLVVESPDQNKYKKIYPIRSQIPSQLIPSVEEQTDLETSSSVSCSNNKTFTQNSTYQIHLTTLLSSLNSAATTGNTRFYNATVTGNGTDTVYGLYMCEGDTPPRTCRQCVDSANQVASSEKCRWSKEAIIWINGGACMLRYSNRSFFSKLERRPRIVVDTEADIPPKQRERFGKKVEAALEEVVGALEVEGTSMKFARKEAFLGVEGDELLTMESVGECTWDLSTQDCSKCLRGVLWDMKSCCVGKQGGGVMYPSCFLRFELKKDGVSPTRKAKGESWIIIIVVVFIVVFVLLSCFALYISRRKKSKSYKAILREYFGSEGATLKTLQFSLATIENATNNFSHENKIGKGGYGEVYKGILLDGREIAVKRLSINSGQGVVEFKNEVLLITKLQHRNLVTLLGFCLKKQEKILIYEYVPNKSLDYFLFGPQEREALNWSDRYKIIGGIALGILYLHEHSRLKVIHRDLKPSNILLDNQMNPKISDFGMAKLVDITESEGCTNRIVGTYGYMSPEYVMFGQFSEKSDVFSFGVMILEIVSGKRNNAASCHESEYNQGLLSYAWKQWREKNLLEMMDSNMTKLGSNREVIAKCIHIGLLCVQANPNARPSMGTIVQYLSNDSIHYDLAFPQEPAFFSYGQMEPTIGSIMKSGFGDQHPNCSKSCSDSVNEMSHSDFFPR